MKVRSTGLPNSTMMLILCHSFKKYIFVSRVGVVQLLMFIWRSVFETVVSIF